MRDASHYAARVPGLPPELQATAVHRVVENELALPYLSAGTAGKPIDVVANHGRWVVHCPGPCGGAQLASPTDPRFLCFDCGNADNGGRYRPVRWPKKAAEIAALLDARADRTLRNWTPGETVADLKVENRLLSEGVVL